MRQQSTTKNHENLNFFVEIILKKKSIQQKSMCCINGVLSTILCKNCNWNLWQMKSTFMTVVAFGVHKVLRRKCRLTDYQRLFWINLLYFFFWHTIYYSYLVKNINEFSEHGASYFLLQRMICHKIHICNLCCLHELCKCVASNCLYSVANRIMMHR